jgi:hypothetical protein
MLEELRICYREKIPIKIPSFHTRAKQLHPLNATHILQPLIHPHIVVVSTALADAAVPAAMHGSANIVTAILPNDCPCRHWKWTFSFKKIVDVGLEKC